ncbi:MAG: DUF177 domain-containing protein [Chloroflexi bacterium]|nr:DUF177 domain-containing protein [Chloroflexota bacterium]
MQMNVAQLLKSPVGATRHYDMSQVMEIADGQSLVQGKIELIRLGRSILAKAKLRTEVELTCSRCLTVFKHSLTLDIEEEYFPTINIITGVSMPVPDEPGAFTIDENNILDLSEAIRQYGLMALPMKPLCREDCAGLCLTCGGNLNQTTCDCPPPVDHRMAVLRKLVLSNNQALASERKGNK